MLNLKKNDLHNFTIVSWSQKNPSSIFFILSEEGYFITYLIIELLSNLIFAISLLIYT